MLNSETTHTEAVQVLIDSYVLSDPAMGKGIGEFVDQQLQTLHDDLMVEGQGSLPDALIVGVVIEEVDLIDIQKQIVLIDDNDDIVYVYENLMKGSRNHLRAFVKNLDKQGVSYSPRFIPQYEYDAIIAGQIETGSE